MVPDVAADRRAFWKSRRRHYNIVLAVSGIGAGVTFFAVLVAWELWPPLPGQFQHADFELFSLVVAPVAYVFAVALANAMLISDESSGGGSVGNGGGEKSERAPPSRCTSH